MGTCLPRHSLRVSPRLIPLGGVSTSMCCRMKGIVDKMPRRCWCHGLGGKLYVVRSLGIAWTCSLDSSLTLVLHGSLPFAGTFGRCLETQLL